MAAGHTAVVAEIGYDEDNVFTFANTGAVRLTFCLSASGNVEGTTVLVAAGATETRTGSELNEGGTVLLVQNDGSQAGTYNVEVEV